MSQIYNNIARLEKEIEDLKKQKIRYEKMNSAISSAINDLSNAKSQNNTFIKNFTEMYSSESASNLANKWNENSIRIENIINSLEHNALVSSTAKINEIQSKIEFKTRQLSNLRIQQGNTKQKPDVGLKPNTNIKPEIK